MSLPTPAQQNAAVQDATAALQGILQKNLGISFDASQVAAVLEVVVDSLCMKQWKQAHAAGAAASAGITTEDQAEQAQRKTP